MLLSKEKILCGW